MRHTREILRQKWVLGRSHREVEQALGVSDSSVGATVVRARHAGLTWETVQALDDAALEARIYGAKPVGDAERPVPDWVDVHAELRKPGVTLQLLHMDYLESHPSGFRYSKYCALYRDFLSRQKPTMRQVHRAGEKMFVDFSGKRPWVVDAKTGQGRPVELFVAVLGASNLTFARAVESQSGPDWVACHVAAFQFFGGVARATVPDNLRSGVTRPCFYEPTIQRTYEEMATHYGTVVLPARAGHPRDKAKVEVGVQVVQRWVLARLRKQTFFSLAALNERIEELLEELNQRPMRAYKKSRQQLFDAVERAELLPLPSVPFTYAVWSSPKVNVDYHVQVDDNFYSVPFSLLHERLEARLTASTVELFLRGHRVASHPRLLGQSRFSTLKDHMPQSHARHLEWTPTRIQQWAGTIGASTLTLVKTIMERRAHVEQGYRACLGILRLGKKYGAQRLEVASTRAVAMQVFSYRFVESVLKNNMDKLNPETRPEPAPLLHENVRGPGYYH